MCVRRPLSWKDLRSHLFNGYALSPIRWLSWHHCGPISHTSQFLKIRASCTLPGQPATTCKNCRLLAQIPWRTMEWNFFRLMYTCGWSWGATIRMWVPPIAPWCHVEIIHDFTFYIFVLGHADELFFELRKTASNIWSRHRITVESVTLNQSPILCIVSWWEMNQVAINNFFSGFMYGLPLWTSGVRIHIP